MSLVSMPFARLYARTYDHHPTIHFIDTAAPPQATAPNPTNPTKPPPSPHPHPPHPPPQASPLGRSYHSLQTSHHHRHPDRSLPMSLIVRRVLRRVVFPLMVLRRISIENKESTGDVRFIAGSCTSSISSSALLSSSEPSASSSSRFFSSASRTTLNSLSSLPHNPKTRI
jgi:hypothetical protein